MQRLESQVRNITCESLPGISRQISNEREEEFDVAGDSNCSNWFFYIETEQSCDDKKDHVPVLLVMHNLEELESIYCGYDSISTFCTPTSEDEPRVRMEE